jgi:hypothetical protein
MINPYLQTIPEVYQQIAQLIQVELLWRQLRLIKIQGASLSTTNF